MNLFTIDQEKCNNDGICAATCPLGLIEIADGIPVPIADATERCIKCGHCVAVCPTGAFTHNQLNPADFPLKQKELAVSSEQAEHFFRSRRSIRTYKEKEIDQAAITKLISIARYSPTGVNSQQIQWLVINSRKEVVRLTELVVDMIRGMVKAKHPMAEQYHLADAISAWESGHDTITRGAPALVVASAPQEYSLAQTDCTSALAYLDLAAPTLGLGCCWAGFVMGAANMFQPFQEALALPDGHICGGIMMLGYPKFSFNRLVPRNEAQITFRP